MKNYMTTFKERLSYWTYFVGQNVYYNITFIYLSAYLAMQGIALWSGLRKGNRGSSSSSMRSILPFT